MTRNDIGTGKFEDSSSGEEHDLWLQRMESGVDDVIESLAAVAGSGPLPTTNRYLRLTAAIWRLWRLSLRRSRRARRGR